ncbi:MAG: VTT domain-containing protein [Cytophagales bacterium]|nr:VTT domain-containing protein [Cytophagales bacterium]
MNFSAYFKENKRSFFSFVFLGVVPLVCSSSITAILVSHEQEMLSFDWKMWLVFYTLTSVTMAFAITPTTYISIVSGYFLGWNAAIPVVISYLLASYIGYTFAKFIDKGTFINYLSKYEKSKIFIKNIQKKESVMVILARISPILPFSMMNVLLSILKVDLKKFLIGGLIGMLPRTLLSIFIGIQVKQINQLFEQDASFNQIATLVLIIVSSVGILYFINKMIKVEEV